MMATSASAKFAFVLAAIFGGAAIFVVLPICCFLLYYCKRSRQAMRQRRRPKGAIERRMSWSRRRHEVARTDQGGARTPSHHISVEALCGSVKDFSSLDTDTNSTSTETSNETFIIGRGLRPSTTSPLPIIPSISETSSMPDSWSGARGGDSLRCHVESEMWV